MVGIGGRVNQSEDFAGERAWCGVSNKNVYRSTREENVDGGRVGERVALGQIPGLGLVCRELNNLAI